MSVSQHGYFCDSCQKEVIDFRSFSDADIQTYFLNVGNKKVCGAFLPSQLTISTNFKTSNWIFSAFSKVSFFMFLMLQKLETEAQIQPKQPTIQTEIKKAEETKQIVSDSTDFEITISGVVLAAEDDTEMEYKQYKKGDPINWTTISIEKINLKTQTDTYGKFTLKFKSTDSLYLHFFAVGFLSKTIKIDKKIEYQFIEVLIKPDPCGSATIGELVPGYRNIFRRTYMKIFHPKRYKCIYYQ